MIYLGMILGGAFVVIVSSIMFYVEERKQQENFSLLSSEQLEELKIFWRQLSNVQTGQQIKEIMVRFKSEQK